MENFKELTLNDKDLFTDYLKDFNNKSYEYSFTALYLWRDLCKTKYSIIDNCLIIKKKTLEDKDISKVHDKILKALEHKLGAVLR